MGKGVGLFNYVIYITNVHPKKKEKEKEKKLLIKSALLQKKYVFLAHTFIKNLSKF